jgi:hypothetical protein
MTDLPLAGRKLTEFYSDLHSAVALLRLIHSSRSAVLITGSAALAMVMSTTAPWTDAAMPG